MIWTCLRVRPEQCSSPRESQALHAHIEGKTKSLDDALESEIEKASYHVKKKPDRTESRKRTLTADRTEEHSHIKKPRAGEGSSSRSLSAHSGKHAASVLDVRSEGGSKKCWMASNLRVRIVDRHYSKGLYYNQKVEKACCKPW